MRGVDWGVIAPDVMRLTLFLPSRTDTGCSDLSLGGAVGKSVGWYLASRMLEGMRDHSSQSRVVRWQRMSHSVSRNHIHP